MFKFEFQAAQSSTEDCLEDNKEINVLKWFPSQEILINLPEVSKLVYNHDASTEVEPIHLGSEDLIYIKPSSILHRMKDVESTDDCIFHAENDHSDLVPSKYEGGLKVWECTHDIAKYLNKSQINGKSVLDLGCGVGLLGILALRLGADTVHFQDYNADVLRYATIPNVQLNTNQQTIARCKFFSGDWESFTKLNQFSYDLVISSETIYNPNNHLKLHNTIQSVLKPSGVALVGAKSYYFGVGGSTNQFEKLVRTRDIFNVEVVWKCCEGDYSGGERQSRRVQASGVCGFSV